MDKSIWVDIVIIIIIVIDEFYGDTSLKQNFRAAGAVTSEP